MRVVVIGGGIGGLCLAHGLRRAGVGVTVFERDADRDARIDRYRLHLDPAGVRSLRACLPPPLWEGFLDIAGDPGGGFGFLDARARELVVIEDEVMYPPSAEPGERACPVDRSGLRQLLQTGLDDTVRFGAPFTGYDLAGDDTVTANFADGRRAPADVLVGADGARSRVRAQLLPDATVTDLDVHGIGLTLSLTADERRRIPPRLAHGENIVLAGSPFFLFTSAFRRSRPGHSDVDHVLCAFVARRHVLPDDVADLDGAGLQRVIGKLIARWHPDLRRLIAACDPSSAAVFPFASLAPPPAWPSGPVTLLGDAAHLMPPTGGIGANTALRDASLLTLRLRDAAGGVRDLRDAVGDYEAETRDYGTAAVRASLRTLRRGLATNPLEVIGARAFLRTCGLFAPLRRASFKDNWAAAARRRSWEHAAVA